MVTDLSTMLPDLFVETGRQLEDGLLLDLLTRGVNIYNARASRPFAMTGSALDREADEVEQRLLVLFGVLAYLNWKLMIASENAVSVSNPAGRTDLTSVEWALGKRRKELLEEMIGPLFEQVEGNLASEEAWAGELGETKDLTTIGRYSSAWRGWPW